MLDRRSVVPNAAIETGHLLTTLTPEEWLTPSLCTAWTVEDVAAHLAWALEVSVAETVTGLCRAGLRVNKFTADSAVRWARRRTDAILAQLHAEAECGATVRVADWHIGLRWPPTMSVGGEVRQRLAGLRLVADDAGWSHGQGPEVHGSSEAIILLLTGRPVEPGELTGTGAGKINARG